MLSLSILEAWTWFINVPFLGFVFLAILGAVTLLLVFFLVVFLAEVLGM